jgi:hypothetical protein
MSLKFKVNGPFREWTLQTFRHGTFNIVNAFACKMLLGTTDGGTLKLTEFANSKALTE